MKSLRVNGMDGGRVDAGKEIGQKFFPLFPHLNL